MVETKTKRIPIPVIDNEGVVVSVKFEDVEWRPTHFIRPNGHTSKSTLALRSLKVGEVKKITHGDLTCHLKKTLSSGSTISCTLFAEITKLRAKGWNLEQYHEKDHVMVVRRLK